MALPTKINNQYGFAHIEENGGKGSGNFGHAGRPGEIGGSSKDGGGEQLSGPAKTREEYVYKRASKECHDEASGVYGSLCKHAEWIADDGSFAEGYNADDYWNLADRLGVRGDKIGEQSRTYTQQELVGEFKRLTKDVEPYGLLDGSSSNDKLDEFLAKYDMDDRFNSVSDVFENGGKGSGNFGHSGRPGEVGGSGDGKGVKSNIDELKKSYEKAEEELDRLSDKLADAEEELEIAKEDDNTSYASDMRKRIDELSHQIDIAREHRDEAYDKLSQAKSSKKESGSISLKGKSLYEKVHMIEAGDEVHITPKDNLPNFDRKIKVDYIQDGTIHYGSSETSDGYTYPAWAIKDITKIIRKKKNYIAELKEKIAYLEKLINGGKGSGNFGHSGRPGQVGGSGDGKGAIDEKATRELRERLERLGESFRQSPGMKVLIEKDKTGEVKDEIVEKTGLEKDLYEKKQAKVERIKEKIGKDIDITADDLSDDPWRDLRYITVTDKDGEEYSYDAISEQVHKRSSGEEMLAPSVKKALADKDELWKKPSWEIKGQEVKKKLKEYGINTDGLSVSRKSGGYSDAWYISGSGKKTDLKSAERILKDKLESYERDVSGEILMGGNTFVFVTDTDRNSLKKKETSEYNGEMMMGMPSRYGVDKKINSMEGMSAYENGGPGSGNFGHAGRPGEVGGSSKDGLGSSAGKYDVKDGKEARKYLTDDAGTSLGMLWEVGVSPENYGFTYDVLGKPTRLSRFEKDADDKLWRAWASMQKVQDNPDSGDVRGEGLATSHDALKLAKAVIATSQTAYLPSERKVAQEQTEKFVKGVKDEVKKQKIKLTADSKKYGETDARKATRKALDDISSAMDGFIGYDKPSREYKD